MSWIDLPEVTLRYELTGRGGKNIVLLHELGGSLESFSDLSGSLHQEFRILRYDQRGAGQSEKPRRAFTLDDHVGDLERLLKGLDLAPPYRLAGVAAGAAIAVGYALAHPDEVAALVLCAPALSVAPERRRYLSERSQKAVEQGMRAIVDASLGRSYPPVMRGDQAMFEAYRARFLANDPVTYAHANLALAENRLEERLGELRVPCLVLAGRHDLLRPPRDVEPLAGRIPGAEYAMVESGHLMSVQVPQELSEKIGEFLARSRAGQVLSGVL